MTDGTRATDVLSRCPGVPVRGHRVAGYVLLETVLATGLLIVGLAVLGAQFQDGVRTVHKMERQSKALMLADSLLAKLSLGLVDYESADDVQEEEFGPRYPSYGWRMTLDETGTPDLIQLKQEILYFPRETDDEDFDFEQAEVLHTAYTLRQVPRKVNLQDAFGIPDDEFEELSTKLEAIGIPELDPTDFDFSVLGGDKMSFDDIVTALPVLLEAFGLDPEQFASQLPPEYRDLIEGLLRGDEEADPNQLIGGDTGGNTGGGRP
ncbi:MAG: hypothetical protein ACE5E5_11445 [Phycisphaerae bacterium]